jgi:hypothetical protein
MQRDFLIEVYEAQEPEENESLSHHGVNGMHWGVRRYQNKDGSLTPEGRRHWGIGDKIKSAKAAIEKKQKAKKMAALRKKKSEILARGDVDEILENKKLFTTNELDKAIGRSQRISMLKAMTPEQQKAREKTIKDQEKAARGKEAVDRGLYRAGQLVQMAPAMIQCYAIVRGLLGHGVGSVPTPTPTSSPSPTSLLTSNQNGSHSPTSIESALASVTYNKKYKLKAEDVESLTTTAPSITVDTSSLPSWSNPTTNAVFTDCVHTAANVPMSSLTSSTTFSANTPGFNILSDQSYLNDAIVEYN